MDVRQRIFTGTCFYCLAKTNQVWCIECEKDFIRETSRCSVCAKNSVSSSVCGSCLYQAPYYSSTEVLFNYEYPTTELIKAFKYNKKPELAKVFAEQLSRIIRKKNVLLPQTIVPVPLHKKRQRDRGYNQSLEIAKEISKQLCVKLNPHLCNRTTNTDPQSSLPMKTRKKNVKGAFSLGYGQVPKHIAIIDDVITTGSTINELAALLKKAGCQRIDVWAIAKT
jgi:ComF family protein